MKNVNQYQVLISAPPDVKEELAAIHQVFDNFNRGFGLYNNISLLPVHWDKDAAFTHDADFIIAILWTRFSAADANFGSVTEEEIEELLKDKKQVFLYISKRDVSLDEIDYSQYEKVRRFRDKYQNKGVFSEFKTIEELSKDLYNHLCTYFTQGSNTKEEMYLESDLSIKVHNGRKLINNLEFYNTNYVESEYFSSLIKEISDELSEINDMHLMPDGEERIELDDDPSDSLMPNIRLRRMVILEKDKEHIQSFIGEHGLGQMAEDFFDLGNLKEKLSGNILMGRLFFKPVGTKKEEAKYNKIFHLMHNIVVFEELKVYLSKIDMYKKIWFVLANEGDHFDQDITINLFIPKGKIITKNDFETPSTAILDVLRTSIGDLLKPHESYTLKEYPDYSNIDKFRIYNSSIFQEGNRDLEEFWDKLSEVFVYEIYESNHYDIVQFDQSFLKQFSYTNFPTFICLKEDVDEIKYEIISKFSNKKIEGVIDVG